MDLTKRALCAGVGLSVLAGCATVVRGTTDTLTITTIPEGARVVSDIPVSTAEATSEQAGAFYGCPATPCSFEVPRRSGGQFTVSLAGHQPIRYRIVSSVTTSNDVLAPGTIIAGLPPGSHVVVGTPQAGSQLGLRGASGLTGVVTYGAGSVIDAMSGANLNVVPQAVTIYLAPIPQATAEAGTDDDAIRSGT